MKAENDWHYAGQGVRLGDAGKPVCWWRPDGGETYRVIYGDLNVRDVPKEEVPESQPEPEAALFEALFPKMWPSASPDPDVWPWVIGEKHPMYQGEEGKTPEMKAKIDALRFPWVGY